MSMTQLLPHGGFLSHGGTVRPSSKSLDLDHCIIETAVVIWGSDLDLHGGVQNCLAGLVVWKTLGKP